MIDFDLYLDPTRPSVGLYVRKGAGLPDIADGKEWLFDGTVWPGELSSETISEIEANGHAFVDLKKE